MLEKWTKRFASKATDNAMEGVKKTLNDRIDTYGDILQFGLVTMIICLGGRHITKKTESRREQDIYSSRPMRLYEESGKPIIINNYYSSEREEKRYHEYRERKEKTEQRASRQKRQNRR